MAFQFPPSPTVGQTFTPVAGVTYRWSGTAWHLIAGPGAFLTAADADTRYVNVDEAQNTTNRIINGKMAIDQRYAGAEVLVTGSVNVIADRWTVSNLPGMVNAGRKALSPDGYYLQVKTATAKPALGAADELSLRQIIEGVNLADLAFGTANASGFTLAFEIRGSVAGNYVVSIRGGTPMMTYVTLVPVTTNFTTVVLTVPPATTGSWETGNGPGFYVDWGLAIGSNLLAPSANTWVTGSFPTLTGATNLLATVGNTLDLRNVRLYKGSVDFGPDRRLYAEELALCQRYYEKTFRPDTAPATGLNSGDDALFGKGYTTTDAEPLATWFFKVEKRAPPTITLYNVRPSGAGGQWTNFTIDSAGARVRNPSTSKVYIDNTGQLLTAASHWFIAATASAEL